MTINEFNFAGKKAIVRVDFNRTCRFQRTPR